MYQLEGTWKLIKLILKRDKIKLPIIIIGFGILFFFMVASIPEVFTDDAARQNYLSATGVSAAARAFNGVVTGTSMGEITTTETFTFMSIFMALISIFTITRHTRQNEEFSRAEIVNSLPVGRNAMLAAALIVAIVSNIILGILATLSLTVFLPVEGAVVYGAGFCMIGIVFAGIAAFISQITLSARSANGISSAILGLAFLLRGIGDVYTKLGDAGEILERNWVGMLSPIGWAQRIEPFGNNNIWPLFLMIGFSLIIISISLVISSKRDLGSGLISLNNGSSKASPFLLSLFGLTWRFQRGLFFGWLAGLIVMAITLGSVTKEVDQLLGTVEELKAIVSQLGGTSSFVDAYLAFSMSFFGITITAYYIQSLLKIRGEEAEKRLDLLISARISRMKWILANIFISTLSAIILLILTGSVVGLTYGLMSNNVSEAVFKLLQYSLTQIPAMLVLGGITIAIFGFKPNWTNALSWTIYIFAFILFQFGGILKLPEWLTNLSPFTHISAVVIKDIKLEEVSILLGISLVLFVVGIYRFKIRDLDAE